MRGISLTSHFSDPSLHGGFWQKADIVSPNQNPFYFPELRPCSRITIQPRFLHTEHERVSVLAEATGLEDVLDIGLNRKFFPDLENVACVGHGFERARR